jgi:hypothetical protein
MSAKHAGEPASPEDGSNLRRSLQIDMKGLVGDAVGNVSRVRQYIVMLNELLDEH